MPPAPAPRGAARPIDAAALAHIQRRLQRRGEPPWLHGEVARRMAERLPVVKLRPRTVLDWGAALGASRALLQRQYPQAVIVAAEPSPAAPPPAAPALRRWWSLGPWAGRTQIPSLQAAALDAGPQPPAQPAAELLWANMALHLAPDPLAVMRQWQRWVAVDGFLMFSTLGPGSLEALRRVHAAAGWGPAHAPFVDMHDLGDMLVEAGFADPVMDQETLTLHWTDAAALLSELRGLGGNADPARHVGLRTPRWRRALEDALAGTAGPDGRPALVFEVVYGHAFRPAPRVRVAEVSHVGVEQLRAMARRPAR